MIDNDRHALMHYGIPKRSGRYPWGSGKDPFQHSGDFLSRVKELQDQGMSETAVASAIGLTTTQLRVQKSLAREERRSILVSQATKLREEGWSLDAIAKEMGYSNDSSVRSLLNVDSKARMDEAKNAADFLKKQIDERGMIDVGKGVEAELNISSEKLNQALYILEREGYPTYGGGVPQVTNPGKQTILRVVGPPGTEHKDIYNYDKVNSLTPYVSTDDGQTFRTFQYPASLNSNRIKVRYSEEGGSTKDGLIELRRNVDDISMGESKYSQVRILVDGKKYMKGMAVYSDDIPEGVDVIFNTNKSNKTPKADVFKDISDDPDNPFGSYIKPMSAGGQRYYIDKNGKEKLSVINKRSDEGDWDKWSDNLASQFLSKQNITLINRQLGKSLDDKMREYEEIINLTNPTVKKKLLQSFADDCDSDAVSLHAAALPKQKWKVILPIDGMKDGEAYIPTLENGTKVALVRYPHGGTFEIPIVTVNNKVKSAKNIIGNALDAAGINSKVAERLSGADFDGDTVIAIPIFGKTQITSRPNLEGLVGFDPKVAYPYREGMRLMKDPETKKDNTQIEMGKISNLITDMTIRGANQDELARAVRHSMVVIDAGKHKLDYTQSAIDNDIASLKKTYQGYPDPITGKTKGGASTLISRASAEVSITKRKGAVQIDPVTGKKTQREVVEEYVDPKTGKTRVRTQKSTQMAEVDDANLLSAGTIEERAYANYANSLKSLANTARKSSLSTGSIQYSSAAKEVYIKEVTSLKNKLRDAQSNAPRERQAQLLANSAIKAKKQDNPDITKSEEKKMKQQELERARIQVGAQRRPVDITDTEWSAIQAGAITPSMLTQILNATNLERVRELATPRTQPTMSSTSVARMRNLNASGYTIAEIASQLGVSSSTINRYMAQANTLERNEL